MRRYYLGIDQGTTGTTSLIFDNEWQICGKGYTEHKQYYPQPGWVEHDPLEIWDKTIESVAQALETAGLKAADLRAVGLDNQGETCMVWDKISGEPLYQAIVWQDRRTAQAADRLREKAGELISRKTGVQVDAYFSALKIKWMIDNVEEAGRKAERGELLAGTLDTWLLWKLTGGALYMTDPSTASRTMLFNLHTRRWDEEILELIGIRETLLPSVNDSIGIFAHTTPDQFFGAKVPICGSAVDQASALFGQACFDKGTIKTTYGTGCFMLMNTGEKPVLSRNGLVTTVAWGIGGKLTYALDGGVYITGAAVQWLRDGLQIIKSADETEKLAASVPDSGDVYFVPAFVGLAAPYWDQYARGMLIGLTGGTTRAHIVRATLEAIAFQVAENLQVMRKDSGLSIETMRVDGGAVVNKFLMQFQADILGIPVQVPVHHETTALGAALLAALGVGDFDNLEEIKGVWKLAHTYEPTFSNDRREAFLDRWKKAVARCRNWTE